MEKKIKILLVTPHKNKIAHYREQFKFLDAELASAENSCEALRCFNEHFSENRSFSLVMLEYNLPGHISGAGLAEIFTRIDQNLKILIFPTAELYEPLGCRGMCGILAEFAHRRPFGKRFAKNNPGIVDESEADILT